MTNRIFLSALCAACVGLAGAAGAQQHDPATPAAVAAKVALRGEANGIAVLEMRLVRKNDILSVQADLSSSVRSDRTLFYRFKWLDNVGNQVGDGESWKQLTVLGLGQQTIKSVAPTGAAVDLRLEMNVEPRCRYEAPPDSLRAFPLSHASRGRGTQPARRGGAACKGPCAAACGGGAPVSRASGSVNRPVL